MNAFNIMMTAIYLSFGLGIVAAYAQSEELTEVVVTGTYIKAELEEFELIPRVYPPSRDTDDVVRVVGYNRDYGERVYCIRGVEYLFEINYFMLWGRDGLPVPCDRTVPDSYFEPDEPDADK